MISTALNISFVKLASDFGKGNNVYKKTKNLPKARLSLRS